MGRFVDINGNSQSSSDTTAYPGAGLWTDRSGTITAGGSSQQLAAANSNRKRLLIQNPFSATESIFFNWGSAASASGGSIELPPGWSYDSEVGPVSTEAVSIIAATTSHAFTAKEMS